MVTLTLILTLTLTLSITLTLTLTLSCNQQATLREHMAADGFIWYDTGQAHIVADVHFDRCGAADNSGGGGGGGSNPNPYP